MLNLEQLSNNKIPFSVQWRSKDICGFDYGQLYHDLDSCDSKSKSVDFDELLKLNKGWLKLNECVLYCQDPNHLRVEIDEHKSYCDFDIFVNNEFRYGKRTSIKYHEQLYVNINNFYHKKISVDQIDDFIKYDNRNKVLKLLKIILEKSVLRTI